MLALVIVEAVVIGILCLLVAGLLRSHADILRALHEIGVGEHELAGTRRPDRPGPSFETQPGVPQPRPEETGSADIVGATADGGAKKVTVVGTDHTTLLAFLSTNCLTCREFWDAFSTNLALPGRDTRLVIVTQGPEAESPASLQALSPRGVTVVMSSEAWHDYAVPVAPYFLLVDGPSGSIIGEGAAASWEQVSSLLAQALADTGRTRTGESTPLARASGAEREAVADDALLAAGIGPGDPQLYHENESRPDGDPSPGPSPGAKPGPS